ncbi:MAG: aspartate aminotransferase family protein [Gemmatimonadetes bacterium]|nr:aspartate aminotransferase family protein [Gemmatimonadota bacterium]
MGSYAQALSSRIENAYRDRTPGSRALYAAALAFMPGGDTRNSTFFRPYPLYMERGEGCRLWDVDGNQYLDFQNNYASLVHGHAHPQIVRALTEQAGKGTVHGAPVASLNDFARDLTGRVPSLERVRFTNSGTEAVMGEIRAARAYTGKSRILKMEGAYHGSYDGTAVGQDPGEPLRTFPEGRRDGTGLSPGLMREVLVAPYNHPEGAADLVRRHAHELAAVIVEPMLGRGAIPAESAFLEALRAVSLETGVVLIFDEIQTFRLAWGGAQALYGVTPDLTTLGKVIGGGLPVGAFGGRAELLERYDPRTPGHVPHVGTFNGNAMTVAAGLRTLELLTEEVIVRLNDLGERLRRGLQSVLDRAGITGTVTGLGSYAHLHFRAPPIRSYRDALPGRTSVAPALHLALLNRGILSAHGVRFAISTVMGHADVDRAVQSLAEVAEELGPALRRPSGRGTLHDVRMRSRREPFVTIVVGHAAKQGEIPRASRSGASNRGSMRENPWAASLGATILTPQWRS